MENLLIWKIYSCADVFGVKSYVSPNGKKKSFVCNVIQRANWKLFGITYNRKELI